MKSNLKSGNAIVRLLLAHGEKLGILAIITCTGLIIWSAIGRERLQVEPAELKQLASSTETKLAEVTWNALPPEEVVKAQPLPPSAMVKIDGDAFPPFPHVFNPPVSAPVTPRTDPVLLALSDLEVNSDSGLWASADPDMIKQKMLDFKKEMEEERKKREEELKRAQNEGGRRGGAGGGGYGGGGYGEGGGYGGGGYGGDYGGGLRGADNNRPRDAPIVQPAREGARLQGFEEIEAKSWVTILAKVPIKAQNELYTDALASSRGYDPNVDMPRYIGYRVERAEITSSGQSEWQVIKAHSKSTLEDEISTYPVNVADVVDPAVKHSLLTHPLPPLILQEWGERVSHSSMPLAAEVLRLQMEEMKNPQDDEEEDEPTDKKPGEDDLFADVVTARERAASDARGRGAYGGGYGGEFGGYGGEYGGGGYGGEYGGGGYGGEYGGGGYGGEFGGGYGGEYGGGGYGGEFGGGYGGEYGGYGGGGEFGGGYGGRGGFGGMGGSIGMGSETKLPPFVWDHETEFVLFRYFDNTAKPGHSYRYRVRLAMADVNHKVEAHQLDETVRKRREETGNKNHRWTDWSEPSPIASVPMPARIYLVSTQPAKEGSYTAEPEAEILVKALNSRFAAEIARTEEFGRGYVINVQDKAKVIWASKLNETEFPEFKLFTGITVLDFDGGKKMSRDMNSVSRSLMMDAAGHLFVQDEMDDLETTEEYTEILEADKNNRARRGGGPGGGYGGEYGGGYGGEYGGGEY